MRFKLGLTDGRLSTGSVYTLLIVCMGFSSTFVTLIATTIGFISGAPLKFNGEVVTDPVYQALFFFMIPWLEFIEAAIGCAPIAFVYWALSRMGWLKVEIEKVRERRSGGGSGGVHDQQSPPLVS